jgi:transcription initiation factor IIE alpha subunit
MRLIDAEALENEIVKTMRYVPKDAVLDVACMVNRAPTIEAKPIVHAHWEEVREGRHICSNCKVKASLTSDEYDYMEDLNNYCPYCGAQMDEVVSDTNVGSKMDENHIAEAGKKEPICGTPQDGVKIPKEK